MQAKEEAKKRGRQKVDPEIKNGVMFGLRITKQLQEDMDLYRRKHKFNWAGFVKECINQKLAEDDLNDKTMKC